MRREHAAKKKLLTQEKAGIEKREDVIQAKEYLSNNYLTRLDEITNMLRSAGDGSDDAVSSLSKDEIKELRQEYKELHQEYRQQHTKLSTRNNVLETLEEDIYFFETRSNEEDEVTRVSRERSEDESPSNRVRRISDQQGHHQNKNSFEILVGIVNSEKHGLSNSDKERLLEEIDIFKNEMANLKLQERELKVGTGVAGQEKNDHQGEKERIADDLVELRSRISIFEQNLLELVGSSAL